VLARRRGGLGDDDGDTFAPLELIPPPEVGTMAEGVGAAVVRAATAAAPAEHAQPWRPTP
jgi:hypothetical protein